MSLGINRLHIFLFYLFTNLHSVLNVYIDDTMAANWSTPDTRRCEMCNYSTNRIGNYLRHVQSDAHLNLVHFHSNKDKEGPIDCCSEEPEPEETEEGDTDGSDATQGGVIHTPNEFEMQLDHNALSHHENTCDQKKNEGWFPFSSRVDFYLYVFMNSTTHPVSDAVVKFVIFILKQCGVEGIPSFASIKRKSFGTFDWNDFLMQGNDDGTPMWAVRPSAVAKLAVAHPDVSRSLIRYPRVCSDSEFQCSHPAYAEKWMNDLEFLSATVNNTEYFKNQLCTFSTNGCQQTGRIATFVENVKDQVTEAVVTTVLPLQLNPTDCPDPSKKAFLITERKKNVFLRHIKHRSVNEDELFYKKGSANSLTGPISHKDLIVSSDQKPTVTVPINLFFDDTSTHKSKRWLALHCIQMQLAGIPMDERHKEKNIHFIGASEKVDMMKLVEMAISDIRLCQSDGFISFDALHQKECLIKCPLDVVVADFNVLSHCCNHLGASAVKYCPRCHASSETFDQIVHPRLPEETKRTINRINLRSKEVDKTKLRKQTGVKEHFNCLWDVIDPHRDIPVGLLHLIPLGLAKHLIVFIINQMDSETLKRMGCHLETILPSKGQEFFQYIESRQGKDFKSYLQVAPFNLLFAGANGIFIKLTCCLAHIQKQLYQKNTDEKLLSELQEKIEEYHQLISEHLPHFAKKAKTHLLLHAISDIKRHGPAPSYDEDSFEKNHGRIRDQIFHQNQKARSRDTAERYAQHMLCSHIVTGGFFQEGLIWTQASENILQAGCEPTVMSFLGIDTGSNKTSGEISKLDRHPNGHVRNYPVTDDPLLMMSADLNENTCTSFSKGQCVTSQSLDLVNSGEWVEYTNNNDEFCYGIFKGGVEVNGQHRLLARIQKADDLREEESSLGCPLYRLTSFYEYVPSRNIKTPCPFIHDCFKGKCRVSYSLTKHRVEQQNLSKRKLTILHNENHKIYLLNRFHL